MSLDIFKPTARKGLQPIAIFGEKVMFKFTTDKNNRKKMESELGLRLLPGSASRRHRIPDRHT